MAQRMANNEADERFRWDFVPLMADDQSFYKKIDELECKIQDLSSYQGKLKDKKTIVEFFKKERAYGEESEKPSLYAFLKYSQNMADPECVKLMQRAENLSVKLSSALSFVEPELSSLGVEILTQLKDDPELKNYDRIFENIIRHIPHTLSTKEEKLIAQMGAFTDYENTFSLLSDTEIDFGEVVDENGKAVKLDNSTYGLLVRSPKQEVRLEAHKQLHKGFSKYNKTISSNYLNELKKCKFLANTYNFKSFFEMSLFSEEVDQSVYFNLVDGVNRNLPLFYDYVEAKRRALGLTEFNIADCYAPVGSADGFELEFLDAYDKVIDALGVLGKDYTDVLKRARDERWIDVYPADAKRSGAFSVTTENANPYLMLNYLPTYRDISTIAHELGHSMHTYLTNQTQPYEKRRYETFVAEIASTVNELLLFRYFLKNAKTKEQKIYLLEGFLSDFYATVFRQTMFTEFQYTANELVNQDKPVSYQELNDIYQGLLEKYFGKGVQIHEYCKYEWSRIPHFYNSFYVYTYATGLISAINIVNNIENNGDEAVASYKKFLSSGCSDRPTELLKIAGVDITKPQTIDTAFNYYKRMLEEFKELIK